MPHCGLSQKGKNIFVTLSIALAEFINVPELREHMAAAGFYKLVHKACYVIKRLCYERKENLEHLSQKHNEITKKC